MTDVAGVIAAAPKFSVIVTVRNAAAWIGECLASVAEQADRDYECLVLDDASDDGTWQAAHDAVPDSDAETAARFRIYRNDTRAYVPSTTRRLIELARGEIVVWIGGDDKFSGPHALGRIREAYASNANVDATYGSFLTFPKIGAWPLSLHPPGYPYWLGWSFSHVLTLRRSLALESFAQEWNTAAYLDESGEPYRTAGDVAIYLPVVFRARAVAFIPQIIYMYRRHEHNQDREDRQAQMAAEQRICSYWTEQVLRASNPPAAGPWIPTTAAGASNREPRGRRNAKDQADER